MADRPTSASPDVAGADLIQRVIELCQERKAEDIVCLDVRELVEYMDAMVIVTGRSGRQNRAIAAHVLKQVKREYRILPLSKAGVDAGSWICIDLVDVVLHIFDPASRAHYDLELLWSDAKRTEHETPEGMFEEGDAFEDDDLGASMLQEADPIEDSDLDLEDGDLEDGDLEDGELEDGELDEERAVEVEPKN